ncbi:MAG: hypothetical protein IPH12_13435 [Saprospirales bacterium]|nr:hypothetical protein [Saprospirales bacterium]MBK8922747.1 hypothetical protein [Saprospirales bacterium]
MAASQATTTTANTSIEAGKPTAAVLSPRARIARQILIYHFILIGASGVYYLLRGFDFEEFTSLMGILAPVTAMYGGAVFRYIGRSITEPTLNGQNNFPINSMVKWLVHGHFVTVMLLISLKAFAPNVLNFQDMIMFLTLVESALGVYMGNIILALFEQPKKAE